MIVRLRVALDMNMYLITCCVGSLCASTAFAACSPLPGAETIWSRPSARWVFVGELHGSNETPAAFGDLVCDALAHGKRVTVGLERPSAEQSLLDRILTSPDSSGPVHELLQQATWRQADLDGRASQAMLRLVLSLRELRRTYKTLEVIAFDVPYTDHSDSGRDQAMGKELLSLRERNPRDVIVILTGNAHSMLEPVAGYRTAAMYLPPKETVSLLVTTNGGKSWMSGNNECGPIESGMPAKGGYRSRGIVLDPSLAPFGKADGILSLGTVATPSPPAAGELSPLPPCRKQYLAKHPKPTGA